MGLHPLTFKYSLISDLHLDHPQNKIPYDMLEENVIVAGDCHNGLGGLKFLQKLNNKGHTVFAVDGNHEHYSNVAQGRKLSETTARFAEEHPARHDIDDVLTVLLVNGWYVVSDEETWFGYMNDGKNCVGPDAMTAKHTINMQAALDAEFISDTILLNPERKFIVVTHTAPCVETLDPRYEGAFSNEWYWNPLMRPIISEFSSQILRWHHGHTHAKNEAEVDGVLVSCNPRGYPRENPDWLPVSVEVEY